MSDSAIDAFLDEVREAGKVRGLLREEHVEIIRCALINSLNAAGEDPAAYGAMWRYAKAAITRTDWPVKRRLEELGVIGDVFHRAYSRRAPPSSDALH